MTVRSNTTLGLTILLAGVTSLSAASDEKLDGQIDEIPKYKGQYKVIEEIHEKFDQSALYLSDHQLKDEDKIQVIIDFSQKLLNNSKDIDGEFVDIVNKNFWDLV